MPVDMVGVRVLADELARRTAVSLAAGRWFGFGDAFNPAQPRDRNGEWVSLSGLAQAFADIAGEAADSLSLEDENGSYFDWSSRDGDNYAFELGTGKDAVQLTMTGYNMRDLNAALIGSSLKRHAPPVDSNDRASMLTAMLAASAPEGLYIDDEHGERYIDWSSVDRDGVITFEASDPDGKAVQIEMTPEQLDKLQGQLAQTILRDQYGVGEK